jgi:hypothetical protein
MANLIELIDSTTGNVASYAWPGGYPIFYLMDDGGTLCPRCVNKELPQVLDSTLGGFRDGWNVEGADINWEDANMYCDHCGSRIASAYAECD